MKSIKSSLPLRCPAGLRGSICMRGLADGPSLTIEPGLELLGLCLVENLLPSPLMAVDDAFGDSVAELANETNGWTGRSPPDDGPVDRMKSAKSRIDSD